MTPAIAVDRLTKRYRERVALLQLSFTVAPGEIVGLLGPNGAGKSTTLGILATQLRFDAGTVSIRGHSLPGEAGAARRVLGLVPQQLALYPALTATENLHFFACAQGVGARDAPAAVGHALDLIGLADRAHEPVWQFSIGMRRRLSLAAGILHGPEVVLLDEPTVGVDPQSRERVFAAVLGLARAGAAVLYSTHQMDEAERLCDRLLLVDHGQLLATGTPTALVAGSGLQPQVRLRTARSLPDGWLGEVRGAAPLVSPAQLANRAIDGGVDPPSVAAMQYQDEIEPTRDPHGGRASLVRSMVERITNLGRNKAGLEIPESQQEVRGLADLGGSTRKVEAGLPPYGKLWEPRSGSERPRFIKGLERRES